jgi:phosphocarrier protein
MIKTQAIIQNRAGLHVRPAAALVKLASQFDAEFFIYKDGMEINGKSIIGVMTLEAPQGAILELKFDGKDEKEAAKAITELIANGFGEPK